MHAVKQPLLFEVGNVLMHGCQALEPHAARNLLKGRGVAVARYKRLQEIQNLFLPSGHCHERIIANKRRTARVFFIFLQFTRYFASEAVFSGQFSSGSQERRSGLVSGFKAPLKKC